MERLGLSLEVSGIFEVLFYVNYLGRYNIFNAFYTASFN
jgi:hypothetical protein